MGEPDIHREEDISVEIKNLALRKAHGNDGIPGEAYKSTIEWATNPITKVTNLTKEARPIPENGQKGKSYTYTK